MRHTHTHTYRERERERNVDAEPLCRPQQNLEQPKSQRSEMSRKMFDSMASLVRYIFLPPASRSLEAD